MEINIDNLENKTMIELLLIKEEFRVKHNLYIENNLDERGSMNHKTKEYYCVHFKKRIRLQKGQKFIAKSSYQTFSTYRDALIFSLINATRVNLEFNIQDIMNANKPII